jgi:hypothetical protein
MTNQFGNRVSYSYHLLSPKILNPSQKYLKFWHQIFVIPAEAGIQDFLCGVFSGFPPSRE